MPNYKYITEVAPAGGNVGPEYRNKIAKNGPPAMDGVTTLYELFQASVKKFGPTNCLGRRVVTDGTAGDYVFETYTEVNEKVTAIGSAMVAVGLAPAQTVGIYGANAPEWMISMQACNSQSLRCVPLYDSLGENAIEYILKHAECSVAFVSAAKAATLLGALKDLAGQIKVVVVWGAKDKAAMAETAKAAGTELYTFDEFLALGKDKPAPAVPPKPDDLSTIMYTSGTTGDPKGVMITHDSVVKTIASGRKFLDEQLHVELKAGDVFLSYLPLAHILDRVAEELFLSLGGSIGYWQGDIKLLVDDIGALRPHFFAGVPRVFERIHGGVMDKVNAGSCVKRFLFNYGFNRKLHALEAGVPYDKASPFFDALVFGKIKERLGGRVKAVLSGGAPLARTVEDFLKVTMCCPVVQGYGLTETCASSFIGISSDPALTGSVGPPQPVLSFRLAAVPEMNYSPLATPARGEVCVKGPCVFSGYYKQQDKTDEVLDKDGWFHTGDIGEISPEGALRIIDRKKNIFKLSQGEYIAVEKVEEVYKSCSILEQVWVYGNSFESCVVAIAVPKEAALKAWASSAGKSGTPAELCKDPEAAKWALAEMNKAAKEGKLKGFEVVKAVALEPEPWTPESELLTPTFKMKRPQLLAKYKDEVDRLYASLKKK